MKKLILTTMLTVITTSVMLSQLTFLSNNGNEKITKGNTQLDDIAVVVPIESSYLNHNKIQVSISVSPNSETHSLATYFINLNTDQLKGKKDVKLWLKKKDGSSDFYYGGYGNQAMNINWPAQDRKRTDQVWNLSMGVFGMDISRYEYKSDGYGNTIKEPVYSFTTLKKYPDVFPYDYGAVEENFYSNDRSFAIKKSYSSKKDVEIRSNNKEFDVNRDKNKDLNNPLHQKLVIGTTSSSNTADSGGDLNLLSAKTLSENGSKLIFNVLSFPSSKLSLEETKADLINYMKYYANEKNSVAKSKLPSYMVKWNMELGKGLTYFYPGYGIKLGKTGDNKIALEKYGEEPKWENQQVDGKNFEILHFPAVYDEYSSSWNASDPMKRMYVEEGKIDAFKNLSVIVGESNGKVYVITFYDEGKSSGLGSSDFNFFQEALSNVTIH